MRSLLDEAKKLAEERLKEWDELRLIVGKIHYQYARLAREEAKEESKRDKLHYAAKHYARAAAFLERYSLDAPELRKAVSDACEWLCTLKPEEAKEWIGQMSSTLKADGHKSERLKGWVNSIVYPRLGVGWPEEEQEVSGG